MVTRAVQMIRLVPSSRVRCWADVFTVRGELDQCDQMATHIECMLAGSTVGYWCDEHTQKREKESKP